ncbi:MAG TPA: sigma-70 family RNA polymerase sigma factor [Candidatus Saccharimonadales bacterium]|jgi:RNA polymerase sigma factor (sigma-70 family)|nr:sigma-70 family RNA polymerase sigma factor [Candidatus Saccharimonadales bacterium]
MGEYYYSNQDDPVLRDYLRDIQQFPLLDAGEEVELAKTMEAGHIAARALETINAKGDDIQETALRETWDDELHAKQKLLNHKTRGQKVHGREELRDDTAIQETREGFERFVDRLQAEAPSEEEFIQELTTVAKDGEEAEKRFMLSNLRLVVHVAKRFRGTESMEPMDLINTGNEAGLPPAIGKFDPNAGYKFSTYSVKWIEKAIQRVIDNTDRTIRVPVHIEDKIRDIKKKEEELTSQLQCTPSPEELAAACDMSVKELQEYQQIDKPVVSLQQGFYVNDEEKMGFMELVGDPKAAEMYEGAEYSAQLALQKIPKIIEVCLTDRQRQVLLWSCGINSPTGDEMSLGEIGKHLGIPRENANSAHKRAIAIINDVISGKRPLEPPQKTRSLKNGTSRQPSE